MPFIHDHHLMLQHDNVRPQVTRICTKFLEAENIPVIAWPAYSPDMSPIEHDWDALDRRVRQRVLVPANNQQLCTAIEEDQDCKALQRVVRLAERISGSALPSLQDIYIKRCKSRAAKILKDSTHPGNHLFCLLPSGRRFRSMMAKTERLRRSFFPQAIRLLNSNSVS